MENKIVGLIAIILMVAVTGVVAENIWEEDSAQPASAGSTSDTIVQNETPMPAAAAPPEPDATYTIKKDDTLWDLAFQFLGNPFEWQSIWQSNRYITNPDRIYPGDKLNIPGRTAAPADYSQTPSVNLIPSETLGAVDFTTAPGVAENSELYPGDTDVLTSLRTKNVLSAGQLSSAPFLWTTKDQKGLVHIGNGIVGKPESGAAYQLFSRIPVTLFKNAAYKEGDTVAIYTSKRLVMFNNKLVNLVQRTGRAVVKAVTEKKGELLLFEMSDAISGNERIVKDTLQKVLVIDTLVAPDASISSEVFTCVEQTVSPYPYQMIILNRGNSHGIRIGDVFAVYSKTNSLLSVIGIIVHTGESSSTLLMMYMKQNLVSEGDEAKLIRRTKFNESGSLNDGKTLFSGTSASD